MNIAITKEMIDEAISNVDLMLANGGPTEDIYSPKSDQGAYYINNIVGKIGELAFKKAILKSNYKLGVDAHSFESFLNSDICDFFTSKTAKTIDVKTACKTYGANLLINEKIANWRPIHNYVLIQLFPLKETEHTLESIYKITGASILGSLPFNEIKKDINLKKLYGNSIYFISDRNLIPIEHLFKSEFYKQYETEPRYHSKGVLELHLASIEEGPVKEISNHKDIYDLATICRIKNKEKGHYNFTPMFINESKKFVSFSIFNGKFNTSLFLKALLEAEVKARQLEYTLLIPAYIENYIPQENKNEIISIIEQLKCNVDYIWNHNKAFGYHQHISESEIEPEIEY